MKHFFMLSKSKNVRSVFSLNKARKAVCVSGKSCFRNCLQYGLRPYYLRLPYHSLLLVTTTSTSYFNYFITHFQHI